tara:strand:+ start:264 stop:464 length:201 start_codon:yes stop_codon:yes gene_type:complete
MAMKTLTTNLYEKISEALKPIYLTEDEYDYLEIVIDLAKDQIVSNVDPINLLDRLENIVLTKQEAS